MLNVPKSHRRAVNFLPGEGEMGGWGGGGVKPLAKKSLPNCPNFYERVEKKGGPYCNNIGRPCI